MPKEKLKQSLSGLGEEIHTTKQGLEADPKLDKLSNWVDEYLADDTLIEKQEHQSFMEDLRDVADQYEVTHPKLTEVINQVMNALSNMGI